MLSVTKERGESSGEGLAERKRGKQKGRNVDDDDDDESKLSYGSLRMFLV